MFRKIIFQIMVLLILAGVASAANPVATIGTVNGLRGDTVQVPVTLTNVPGVSLAAISVDVGFDVNILENPSAVIGPAGTEAGKFIAFNPNYSPGVMRVALIGFNQTVINDGIIFYVSFKIKSPAACGVTVLTNTPSGSTPDAHLVTMTGVNGAINVKTILNVSMAGTGSGTVTSTPSGINCGAACSNSFDCSATVTLTAAPAAGSTFAGWTGDPDCSDGQVTMDVNKTCNATFTLNSYTVTPSAGANGTINPATPQTANYNETKSFAVTPNTGYHIASVTGTCGGTLSLNTYTTNPITANCTVIASFEIDSYTVTPSAGANGTINPATPQTVNYGATTQFTVTPNTGYTASVSGTCGGSPSSGTTAFTFTTNPITANCTVTATFTLNKYTVTPSAGANGAINPSTPQTVNYNETTSFTVTPNTGYRITTVTGCGGTLANYTTYTTGPITANCTVTANFAMAGDCDEDDVVTIDEVQGAINMHIGLRPVTDCVDVNHDGIVDVSEVQLVINNHLKT